MGAPCAILLISCPDARGIVAAVSGFLAELGANLLDSQQHSHTDEGLFFMRVRFELPPSGMDRPRFEAAFAPVAARFRMTWRLTFPDQIKRMGILVSRYDHCLYDLLLRQRSGELSVAIPFVASNHPDLAHVADTFSVPFHHLQVTPASRPDQEEALLALCEAHGVEFLVLARYMQILTARVLDRYEQAIINIHHSFLPAFAGGRPYHQAYQRGVKVIGATSHYATEDLDEGPIIEQDVIRVNHRDEVEHLVRKGRDLEKLVLARAVSAHAEDRILVHGRRTIVFE